MNYQNKTIAISADSLANGGAEKIACNLANILSDENNVKFISFENKIEYELNTRVKLVINKIKLKNKYIRLLLYLFFARKASSDCDIVVSHMIRPNLVYCFLKIFFDFKLICVHHSSFRRINNAFIKKIVKYLYSKADAVICISSDMLNDYITQHKNKNGVLVYNPHDLARIKYLSNDINVIDKVNSQFDCNLNEISYYTVVGRIIPLKRIETIVESFQNITSDNIKILIVGDGDPKYITAIQGLIKSRNLKDKFVFVGHLSNPYAVIKKSKGVILCSESEGFPNILVEALCLGKPIIASDCISGPREILCINGKLGRNEIIKNEFGILYPVGDALALAKAINYMNENHTTFIGSKIKSRVEEFNIMNIKKKYLSLIN